MNLAKFLFYTIKRTMKKPFYLLLLMLFPIIAALALTLPASDTDTLQIVLYTEDTDGFSAQLVQRLTERTGAYYFYTAQSEAEASLAVASAQAECAYLIPSNLQDSLNQGRKRNLITVITSGSTTMSDITNEIVYAELFSAYSLSILTDYLVNDSVLESPDTAEIASLYQKYSTNGSTFDFDYIGGYEDYAQQTGTLYRQTLKGMLGILILLSGLSGLLTYSNDSAQHIYCKVSRRHIPCLLLIQIAVPVLLSCAAGLLCLLLMQAIPAPVILLQYLFYCALVIVFCVLVQLLVRKKGIILTMIPFYLLGCMIFTPVFIDITVFLPAIRPLCRLFVTYYMI